MNFENPQPFQEAEENPVEYKRKLFKFYATIQVRCMLLSLGIASKAEDELAWVDQYASRYKKIFDRRIMEEGEEFLERCRDSSQDVAIEISHELGSSEKLDKAA